VSAAVAQLRPVEKPDIDASMVWQIREQMERGVEGEELQQRIALLKARHFAIGLITKSKSLAAGDHAIAAREVADAYAFAEVSTPRLDLAVKYCRHLVQCAFLADHLEDALG
jgi:hypothetical protein